MSTIVFGGTAGIGRALCRALASAGKNITILARDRADLEAESAHCRLIGGVEVDWIAVDASDPTLLHAALIGYLAEKERAFENLLFPMGGAFNGDTVQGNIDNCIWTVHLNLTSIMVAVSALLPWMTNEGIKNIVGFGSVAAVRGRRSNVAYSAAKRGLESYFESLRHQVGKQGVAVQFYRLGYVDTQQSYGRTLPFPAIQPSTVAQHVLKNLDRDIGVSSLPSFWRGINPIVRHLPWTIFKRLDF